MYYDYLLFNIQQGNTPLAFEVAQKTKARSLLDLLYSGRVDVNSELTPEEQNQETALRRRADSLNLQIVNEGVQNAVGSMKRAAALKVQLRARPISS